MRKRASEQEKRRVRDREKETNRDSTRRAGEPYYEEQRKTEKRLWRERARGILRLK